MKIFKSDEYQTREKFLELVKERAQYMKARRRGENPRPRRWPPLVEEYARLVEKAARNSEDPPAPEWNDMSEEEWREQEKKREEEEEKERLKAEEEERRRKALEDARSGPEKRDEFIRREMNKRGFSPDDLILARVQKEEDGKDVKDFWKRRKEALKAIRKKIDG